MRSSIAHLSTLSIRYIESGAGTPVVLLHAFPLGAEQWLPQLTRPPRGWRLVAPDLRGFGGVDPGVAAGGISMETYADDVLALMAHLDIPKARIVGVSMGGYVALAMSRKAPSRIAGLVLADTRATADGAEARAARDRMLEILRRGGTAAVAREMLPKLLGATTRREHPDLVDAIGRLVLTNVSEGLAAAVRAMKHRADSTDLLASIACPVTVVCGDEDVITPPAECEALSRAIPGAAFVLLEGAGHLSNVEQPARFTEAMTTDHATRTD